MLVIAIKGSKCPMEGKKRQHITDTDPVDVPGTAYYRRLLMEGSLVAVPRVPVPGKIKEKPAAEAEKPQGTREKKREDKKP